MVAQKESLMNILQYSSQDVYRTLIIMSETLSRLTDEERKTEIIKFSQISRSLFIRLLAITEWSESSKLYSKVEETINKLELYSHSFTDVADKLYYLAYVQLPTCNIPLSCISTAADILSSNNYNRMPTCFKDFSKSTQIIQCEDEINKTLSSHIRSILAIYDFDPFDQIKNHNNHLYLKCLYFDINVSSLNNVKGPWILFNCNILIRNNIPSTNKIVYNQHQLNYLLKFTETRMNSSNEPFLVLYDILKSFCNNIVLQILVIQTRAAKDLTDLQIQYNKTSINLTYWKNSVSNTIYNLSITLNDHDRFQIQHQPPLNHDGYLDLRDINLFKLVSNIISCRIEQLLQQFYNSIITTNESLASFLVISDTSIIFYPFRDCSSLHILTFTINAHTGMLDITSLLLQGFGKVKEYKISLTTPITTIIAFLLDYRRFTLLEHVKDIISGYNFQYLIIDSECCKGHKDISVLCNEYGDIFLIYNFSTSITCFCLIGCKLLDNHSWCFDSFILNCLYTSSKLTKTSLKDIYLREYLNSSLIYWVSPVDKINCFQTLSFRQLELRKQIKLVLCKVQTSTLIYDLKRLNWKHTHCVFQQELHYFNAISLTHFFLSFIDSSCHAIIYEYIGDINLNHDYYQQSYYIHFTFNSDCITKLTSYNISVPHTMDIYLVPTVFTNIFSVLLNKWKSFLKLFNEMMQLIEQTIPKLNSIILRFDYLIIIYNAPYKYAIKLSMKDDHMDVDVFSLCSHSHPYSTTLLLSNIHHQIDLYKNVSKMFNIIINLSNPVYLLQKMSTHMTLGSNLQYNISSQHVMVYPISLVNFNVIYRNMFCLSIIFLENNQIQITDHYYQSIWNQSSINNSRFLPLHTLGRFLSHHCQENKEKCYIISNHAYIIPKSVFIKLITPLRNNSSLNLLRCFLEYNFHISCFICFFRLKPISLINNSYISFNTTLYNITIGCAVANVPYYTHVKIAPIKTQSKNDSLNKMDEITNSLQTYFYKHIISLNYKPRSFTQFLVLLRFDHDFIADFINIINMQLNYDYDAFWAIRWRHDPSNNVPFRLLPMKAFSINQVNKTMIMIDTVYKSQSSRYITTIIIWDHINKRVKDIYMFGSRLLQSKSNLIREIQLEAKEKIKELFISNNNAHLSITQIVEIFFNIIKQSSELVDT